MNKQEFETQLASATALVTTADELEKKLEENTATINERKIGSTAAVGVVKDILTLMKMVQGRLLDENTSPELRLQQSGEVVRSLVTWLEEFPHREREDITRMEATQEGMRRALSSVRDTGQARINTLRELETVAKDPPVLPRKPGQRPIKASTAQHAKELRSSIENEIKNDDQVSELQ